MAKVPGTFNSTADIDEVDLEDPFDNKNTDLEAYIKLLDSVSTFQTVTEVIKLSLYLFVLVGDIYLIVIILRNPKLKAVNTNKILIHYAIFNICFVVSSPLSMIIAETFGLWRYIGWGIYCSQDEIENAGLLGLFLSGFALTLDWLVTVNCTNPKPLFKKIVNNIILINYTILGVNLLVGFLVCHFTYINFSTLPILIVVTSVTIFVIVCDFKRKASNKQKNYSLTIANVVILSWLPFFVIHFLHALLRFNYTMRFIFEVTLFIPEYLAFGSPLIVVVSLSYVNKHFKMAFLKACRCCLCGRFNGDYNIEEEHFENSDEEQSDDNVDGLENKAELL